MPDFSLLPFLRHAAVAFVLISLTLLGSVARAQGVEHENRPVREIRVEGLKVIDETLVRNQIQLSVGDPFKERVVQEDIVRLTHLGVFDPPITESVLQTTDGGVIVTYKFVEAPLLVDVQTVGNKKLSDQELREVFILRPGDPIDQFLIDRALQQVQDLYRSKGYFVATATIDQALLEEQQILLVRIVEGPRVRVRGIRFDGNEKHPDGQLASQVRSETHIPILRSGVLDRDLITRDVARIRDYLRNQGHLDAQVGRQIDFAPDGESAVITFLIQEGPLYRLGEVQVEGNKVFNTEQLILHMAVQPGGALTDRKLDETRDNLRNLYGQLGYINVKVEMDTIFRGDSPVADLRIGITEGEPYQVGKVTVRGNDLTKTNVVLRELRGLTPGRPFDLEGLETTRNRLSRSPYFSEGTVTILGEDTDPMRDILVEVKEKNTGQISLGVGVSSDIGLIGNFSVTQRNFDIMDWPDDWGELFTNRAFRGGGQTFTLTLQPGNEYNRFAIGWRDPYFLESDYFLDLDFVYFNRQRRDYDEGRLNFGAAVGKRFGDVWSASMGIRAERIDISQIDEDAPVDVFAVEGESELLSLKFDVSRGTLDNPIFPTRGSIFRFGIEQAGIAGDFDFTKFDASYTKYWTTDVDFLDRKDVLYWRIESGYIPFGDAPVFERFYAGGHRSLRGFENRGIGPRGIRNDNGEIGDDSIGGDFRLTTRLEYTVPLRGDFLRWAFFTDMGTLLNDPGFDQWRLSVGTGARFSVPLLGNAPFAFDVGFPILKEEFDERQILSFDAAIPFN